MENNNAINVNKKKETVFQNVIVMLLITLVSGFLLGYINDLTKAPIEAAMVKEKNESYARMFRDADEFNEELLNSEVQNDIKNFLKDNGFSGGSVNGVVEVKSSGLLNGYILTTSSSNAYGGNITISLGIDMKGNIVGIDYVNISETAGLGMNAKEDSFKNQFVGKNSEQLTYVKGSPTNDNEIEAITSATVTTSAVIEAVNSGLSYFYNYILK